MSARGVRRSEPKTKNVRVPLYEVYSREIKPEHKTSVFVSAAFISLLDNYESDTGKPEIVTPEEVAENHKFLDSIIKTPTMKVPVVAGAALVLT